jgi:hypothetical protein
LSVQRGTDRQAAALEDTFASLSTGVGVDHGGFHVFMPEKLLDSADVVVVLQQVRGEAVAEGVAGDAFGQARRFGGLANRLLQAAFIGVMTPNGAGTRVNG